MEEICGGIMAKESHLWHWESARPGGGPGGGLVQGEGDAGSRPSFWILSPVELADLLQERLRKERITDFDTWHLYE